jgi:hypothetical protein
VGTVDSMGASGCFDQGHRHVVACTQVRTRTRTCIHSVGSVLIIGTHSVLIMAFWN